MMPEDVNLQEIMDTTVRDITKRMAGIDLLSTGKDPFAKDEDSAFLFVTVKTLQGEPFRLMCRMENRLLLAIAGGMKRQSALDQEEALLYVKEYFNILCGRLVSAVNRQAKLSMRFGVPQCCQSPCPSQGQSLLTMCYQSEQGAFCLWQTADS